MARRQAGLRHRSEPAGFAGPLTQAGGLTLGATVSGVVVKAYDCCAKVIDIDDSGGILLEGAGNAASIGQTWMSLNPADFTAIDGTFTPPREGSAYLYQGQIFTVKKVEPTEMVYGVRISLPLIVFRKGQADAATTETTAEAIAEGKPQNAGLRKVYLPPAPPA
jgi:hypothetical protein